MHDSKMGNLIGALFDIGAKNPIPTEQDAAIVPVQIARIAGVMDFVMLRRNQHAFKKAKLTNCFGVKPKLVHKNDCPDGKNQFGRKTDENQR